MAHNEENKLNGAADECNAYFLQFKAIKEVGIESLIVFNGKQARIRSDLECTGSRECQLHSTTMSSAGDYCECGMCAYLSHPGLQFALTGNRPGRNHVLVLSCLSLKPAVYFQRAVTEKLCG